LIADAGDALGCGAHVATLRRTRIGSLDVSEAVAMDAVGPETVIDVAHALRDMPSLEVDEETAASLRMGRRPAAAGAADGELLVLSPTGPVGVAEAAQGVLRPVVVLS
jgi:tRNA pseudouridine55 synthase